MITRRETALGGLLTIGWLSLPCGCAAHAVPAASRTFGCLPTDDQVDAMLETSSTPPATIPEWKQHPTVVSSGDRDLDYAIAQTLSRLTDTWNALPGFAWFDDPFPSAFATPSRQLSRADGSIFFGRKMLERQLKAKESPDVAISAVCAHEFGHIVQFKYGLSKRLREGQTTAMRFELHADFLAGYFAGVRKRERQDFPAAVYATTLYAAGDTHYTSPEHHGEPKERAAAIVKGFEVAFRDRSTPKEAMEIGMQYVATV